MYGKIFSSMYDGTLYGQWEALVTFQQMIVLADKEGVVDMTPPALAARTSIPLDIIKAGIETLENPDPYSRTPENDGRRLERLDEHRPWGWRIINYTYYRDLASEEDRREKNRIRKQRQREREASERDGVTAERDVSQGCHAASAESRHTDTDTDTDIEVVPNGTTSRRAPPADPVPYQKIVDLWHEILPELPRVIALSEARKAKIRQRWKAGMNDLNEWRLLFQRIRQSRFLMGLAEPGPNRSKPFLATLEWVTKEENFLKILEGKYHGKSKR